MTPPRRPSRLLLGLVSMIAAVAAAGAQELEGRVTRITLDNGMRFLLMRRGTAPVFSATLRFRVGGVDDPGGETGLAHLFEHMAFKGTSIIGTRDAATEAGILDAMDGAMQALYAEEDRGQAADPKKLAAARKEIDALRRRQQEVVVKDELSQILTSNGAVGLNASTGQDLTSYVVSLPTNRLELWCLLESARLRDPVLREFYSERDVVMEERRFRIDTQPGGKLYEQMLLTAFQAHPYRVSTAGWMSDLARLTRQEGIEFHRKYYLPNNAVGALVGDIDPAIAGRLLTKYFGGIPAGPAPSGPVTVEPEQKGERRIAVEFDAEPSVLIAFHKPVWPHPDDPVFQVIDSLLTSGRTGRLFRRLVMEAQVASDVNSYEAPGDRYPNLFVIDAEPRAPHTTAEVESEVEHELARLRDVPVPEPEMQKIRNQMEAAFLYPLRSNAGLASQLSYYEITTGDWHDLLRYYEAIKATTPVQVRDVARRTFQPSQRTVATLQRPAATAMVPSSPATPPPAGAGTTEPDGDSGEAQ